jgi:hypothetical protein
MLEKLEQLNHIFSDTSKQISKNIRELKTGIGATLKCEITTMIEGSQECTRIEKTGEITYYHVNFPAIVQTGHGEKKVLIEITRRELDEDRYPSYYNKLRHWEIEQRNEVSSQQNKEIETLKKQIKILKGS